MEPSVPSPIIFRGQTYPSVDDMPTEIRQAYEEVLRMLNGLPPASIPDEWVEWGPAGPWPGPPQRR
jgi:hypothetical protein